MRYWHNPYFGPAYLDEREKRLFAEALELGYLFAHRNDRHLAGVWADACEANRRPAVAALYASGMNSAIHYSLGEWARLPGSIMPALRRFMSGAAVYRSSYHAHDFMGSTYVAFADTLPVAAALVDFLADHVVAPGYPR